MFVTQVPNFPRRSNSSMYLSVNQSLQQSGFAIKKQSSSYNTTPKESKSQSRRTSRGQLGYERTISILNARLTPEDKWKRIVQLFQLSDGFQDKKFQRIYPSLYSCLLSQDLNSNRFAFQVPQTMLVDQEGTLQLIYSNNGFVHRKAISKSEVTGILEKGHETSNAKLKESTKYKMYGQQIDIKVNLNAPFVVIRWQKGDGSIEVENIRNFGENRWRASPECMVQRYVYSRNLKAMIFRVQYLKAQRGEQHKEYCVHRFQNIANIFRTNSNGLCDSHDLRAKVSPCLTRPNTLQYSKLTGPGVLQRLIVPAAEARRLLQKVTGKRILNIFVDIVEDLAGQLWVVGFKGVIFDKSLQICAKQQWLVASQVGYCRLCSGVFMKSELQNAVSVRMLLQFLHHLKRRTRIEDQKSVQFVSTLSLNRKENAKSSVCNCCYALIIHELQLKKYERYLGRLCNIRVQDDSTVGKVDKEQLRQWRLMVYLQEIKQISKGLGKFDNVFVRYVLGKGIEQKWKCTIGQGQIPVKRVKVHYFFSEQPDIEEFLKNSQILVTLLSVENEEVIAQGSTGILANFKNKFITDSGQRQTTTVLLFFQTRKYCQLTLKVGLVYDGIYKSPEVALKKFNSVLFPTRECLNSNPLPKQWMQAFGYDQQIQLRETKYQQILQTKNDKMKKQTLKKRAIRNFG